MKSLRMITRATVVALLLLAMLLAGVPSAGRTHAAPPVGASPVAVAVAEAVSPATGHLFVVSNYVNLDRETVDKSWVSMLESRSGKLLRTTPIAVGEQGLVVDDRTQHVFVLSGGNTDMGATPLVLTMLDAKTGVALRTVDLGKGTALLWTMQAASRLGLLFVITNPDPVHFARTPNILHVLDTETGLQVRTQQLAAGYLGLAVHQSTGRLYVMTGADTVRIYDVHSWKVLRTLVAQPSPFLAAVDETHGLVAMITGKQSTTLTLLNAASGAVRKEIRLPASQFPPAVVFDEQTNHAFVIWQGTYDQATGLARDGALITVDLTLGLIVNTTPIGVAGVHAAIDGTAHHLFALSYSRIDSMGRPSRTVALVSMLDTRTSRLLRAITIPMAGGQATIVVDAHAGCAYINELGQLDQATNSVFANNVMMLDTHTGAIARTVQLPQPEQAGAVS